MPSHTIGAAGTFVSPALRTPRAGDVVVPNNQNSNVNAGAQSLSVMRNAPSPSPAQPAISAATQAIRNFIDRIRSDEKSLVNIAPAVPVSCVKMPAQTGPAASVTQMSDNAVDCLLKASNMKSLGRLAFVSAADSHYIGGALDEKVTFNHEKLLLEETVCVLLRGAKASLDAAAADYPLGTKAQSQNQLHSLGLAFRHSVAVRQSMLNVKGDGRARIDAQRDILLNAAVNRPEADAPRVDMISIAGVDRRGVATIDPKSLYDGMLRQFANALVTAKKRGVQTVILTFPGSGEFSRKSRAAGAEPDGQYQSILSCAAADAVTFFGSKLNVIVPTHGAAVDYDFDQYRDAALLGLIPPGLDDRLGCQIASPPDAPKLPRPPQISVRTDAPTGNVTSGQVAATQLEERTMGTWTYRVETVDHAEVAGSAAASVLKRLIGSGVHAKLRRVQGIQPPTGGTQPYWFINRDQHRSVALVSVETGRGTREIYEVEYDRARLPDLAREAAKARPK